jgi:hypothetical protein
MTTTRVLATLAAIAAGANAAVSTWDCSDTGILAPVQYLRCGTGGYGGSNKPACLNTAAVDGNGFSTLDVSTGAYTALFTISTNELEQMNACSINPVDSYAYCAALSKSSTHGVSHIRLVRFGSTHADPNNAQFEFVAILPVPASSNSGDTTKRLPNSAAFSLAGNFYVSTRPHPLLINPLAPLPHIPSTTANCAFCQFLFPTQLIAHL